MATDGTDGNGLKFEKIGQFFQVLILHVCVGKIHEKFIMVSLSDKIHMISSSHTNFGF